MLKKLINFVLYKFMNPNLYAKKAGVKFGENCVFRTKYFGSEPYLISIGNNVATSTNVRFITHDGSMHVIRNLYTDLKKMDLIRTINVGNNVFIGINTILLPGTEISDNVIIGAGSVVKGNLKSNGVYAGVPAKYICSIDEYVQKNKHSFLESKGMIAQEKKAFLKSKFLAFDANTDTEK